MLVAAYNANMTIAEVLAGRLAERPDLTQTSLADLAGVTQPTVSRWLKATDTPGDKYVVALVEFTGLTEPQVLAAIHRQRLNKRTLNQRVSDLEEQVRQMAEDVRQLLAPKRARR